MSVMSNRFTSYCESSANEDVLERVALATRIENFDQHECLSILQGYSAMLEDEGLEALWSRVVQDRAALLTKFGPRMSLLLDAALKTKVLRILDYLCHIISNPPYKMSEPSETDSLMVWSHVLSLITDDIALLSGEKMLGTSKSNRRRFVGVFYNIVPLEDVSAAGRVAADFVHFPTTEGALQDFMGKNDTSLAQMFCFFEMLSNKGKMAKRAKESYDLQLAKKGMEQAEGSAQPVTSPPR
ncbi:hypothetical protein BGZ97_006332, partial [Linnemannia gamsii]